MIKEFAAFLPPAEEDREALWENGLFVIDANVLLNVSRFSKPIAEDLLKALEALKDQIWIPHQVALEYHRHLAGVVAGQRAQVQRTRSKVEDVMSKARRALSETMDDDNLENKHTSIDPSVLTGALNRAKEEMLEHLDNANEELESYNEIGPIQERVIQLIEGRTGVGPSDQSALDELYENARPLLEDGVPPGFVDYEEKDGDEGDAYRHQGLRYLSAYGDFVVWKQMLEEVKERGEIRPLAFVTDDEKKDWWRKEKGRKIGPRTELVQEAREHGAQSLFMYTSSQLMHWVQKERDNVTIGEDSVEMAEKERSGLQEKLTFNRKFWDANLHKQPVVENALSRYAREENKTTSNYFVDWSAERAQRAFRRWSVYATKEHLDTIKVQIEEAEILLRKIYADRRDEDIPNLRALLAQLDKRINAVLTDPDIEVVPTPIVKEVENAGATLESLRERLQQFTRLE